MLLGFVFVFASQRVVKGSAAPWRRIDDEGGGRIGGVPSSAVDGSDETRGKVGMGGASEDRKEDRGTVAETVEEKDPPREMEGSTERIEGLWTFSR